MDTDKILQELSKLHKKMDKILNLQTKIAKTLHLIPVSEKEERELQIQQRKNLEVAAKVTGDLDAMSKKEDDYIPNSLYDYIIQSSSDDVYGDVIADDFLGGAE